MFLVVALISATAVAILIMLGVRRYAPPNGFLGDTVPATGVFSVIGVAFAVILAFVVFLSFEGFLRASEGSSREAVAVSQMARTARLLPDKQGQELRNDLACYARAVVYDGWPAMAAGRDSLLVEDWLLRIEATADEIRVDTPRTEVALSHWLEQQSERRDGRRSRLAQAVPAVPEVVWLLLLLGALLTIGYLIVYADPRDRWWVQALMIGSVALLVVAGLLVVFVLDRPYQQDGAYIAPSEMETTIRLMDHDFAGDPTFDPPCDGQGRPVAAP